MSDKIEQLRKKIEQADIAIIEALAERQALSKQIGQEKSNYGKDVVDLTREKKLFEFYEILADKYHLQPSLVKKLFTLIIADSRKVQAS